MNVSKKAIAVGVAIILIGAIGVLWAQSQTPDKENKFSVSFELKDERAGYEKTRDFLISQMDLPDWFPPTAYDPFNPDDYKWIHFTVHYKTYRSSDNIAITFNYRAVDDGSCSFNIPWTDTDVGLNTEGNVEYWYLIPQPERYVPSYWEPIPWNQVGLHTINLHLQTTHTDVYY